MALAGDFIVESNSSKPSKKAIEGSDGVERRFQVDIAPVSSFTATKSVKVPPISIPMLSGLLIEESIF